MPDANMDLSIVIICWNDLKVILDCLDSIYSQTRKYSFEVIVSDNGSADGSVAQVRERFPHVRIVENGANLGFAKGNNAGIKVATGEYILILNPDTVILEGALDKLIAFAMARPSANAFGCRVLNVDGSYQNPARPLPTPLGLFISALGLRWLGRFNKGWQVDLYQGWKGETERAIGMQSGCCILFRRSALTQLEGFDQRFFYHFEETDLCKRVWDSGSSILYTPDAKITHLGGQSTGRFPTRFALETYRGAYRYMAKHFGDGCLGWVRGCCLLKISLRWAYYGVRRALGGKVPAERLTMYRTLLSWHWRLDPSRFLESGEEPEVGFQPMAFVRFNHTLPTQ